MADRRPAGLEGSRPASEAAAVPTQCRAWRVVCDEGGGVIAGPCTTGTRRASHHYLPELADEGREGMERQHPERSTSICTRTSILWFYEQSRLLDAFAFGECRARNVKYE